MNVSLNCTLEKRVTCYRSIKNVQPFFIVIFKPDEQQKRSLKSIFCINSCKHGFSI